MNENEQQNQYLIALQLMWKGACHGQTKPDGKNCTICGDNDHQAFECRFNGFNLFEKEKRL